MITALFPVAFGGGKCYYLIVGSDSMDFTKEDYIDIDDALKRVGGNKALYSKLLLRFVEGNQLEELEKFFDSGNLEEASRTAHTIKGVAANLSLIKLRALSSELEAAIKAGHDPNPKWVELKEVYNKTAEVIAEIVN